MNGLLLCNELSISQIGDYSFLTGHALSPLSLLCHQALLETTLLRMSYLFSSRPSPPTSSPGSLILFLGLCSHSDSSALGPGTGNPLKSLCHPASYSWLLWTKAAAAANSDSKEPTRLEAVQGGLSARGQALLPQEPGVVYARMGTDTVLSRSQQNPL